MRPSRRPMVNVVGGGDDDDDESNNKKYCPRCQFELFYLEEDDIFCCGKCAYNLPERLSKQNREREEELEKNKKKGVVSAAGEESASAEADVFVVPKVQERGKKQDPFAYLKRDDAYLQKVGMTLVKDEIIFADDRSTRTRDELRAEKDRRYYHNRKGGDSYRIY